MALRVVPFTRVAGVTPVYGFLESIGAPAERIAERAGLSTARFDRPDALLPFYPACRFFGLAAQNAGIENLGALVGLSTSMWDLGSYGHALRRSGTLYDVLLSAVRLVPSFSSAFHHWIERDADGEQVWFFERWADGAGSGADQVDAFGVAGIVSGMRAVVGDDWRPERLRVPARAAAAMRGLGAWSDARIDFTGDFSAVAIPRRLLPTALPAVRGERSDDVAVNVQESVPPADFVDALSVVIRTLSPDFAPSLDRVSDAVGISGRSLQRRLASSGLTYSELVARTRLSHARDLLRDPSVKTADVAFELGYADPANFTRAFRRWTGVSPREYRANVARS